MMDTITVLQVVRIAADSLSEATCTKPDWNKINGVIEILTMLEDKLEAQVNGGGRDAR